MKKVQRSFAVEYKSGRRKSDSSSKSIWGDVDLKSVARAVEEDTTPLSSNEEDKGTFDRDLSLATGELGAAMLTPQTARHTSTQEAEETFMADQIETMTTSEAPAVSETPIPAKKQRKPRAKKAVPEAPNSDAAEPGAVQAAASEKPKRGRKAKSVAGNEIVKRAAVKRGPKPAKPAASAPTEPAMPAAVAAATYEMADLLQLEEENHRLRKLLAEKLRAENADLRKRLNLG